MTSSHLFVDYDDQEKIADVPHQYEFSYVEVEGMKWWHYHMDSDRCAAHEGDPVKYLSYLGKLGWMLVGVVRRDIGNYLYYFQREIAE